MASLRCIVYSSSLKFLVRNSYQRFGNCVPRTFDIAGGYQTPKSLLGSRRFLTFHSPNSLFASTTSSNKLLQNCSCRSKLSRFLTPETSALRCFSEKPSDAKSTQDDTNKQVEEEAQLSVFQRFKKTYKEHGKILIIVHCMTSVVWFGSFYMAAVSGVDIVPWMEKMGFSETIIKPFRAGGLGFVALAYLMYKLATPARYTVTLGGTNLVIRYLRRTGKMDPIPKGHNLRSLYKDGKSELKERHETFQRRQRTSKIRKQRVARRKDS